MTTIKLNNYYPHLTECITLEVSEEIAVTLSIGGRPGPARLRPFHPGAERGTDCQGGKGRREQRPKVYPKGTGRAEKIFELFLLKCTRKRPKPA